MAISIENRQFFHPLVFNAPSEGVQGFLLELDIGGRGRES